MTQFGLTHDAFGRLVLIDSQAVRHIDVTPVRAFPNSDPNHWISLVSAEGSELVCLADLEGLPAATRRILEDEFASREFTPTIQRIVRISALSEPSEWAVETDRGPAQFVLQTDTDVRRIDTDRAMIVDAHGTRYRIDNLGAIDVRSRRYLERYL